MSGEKYLNATRVRSSTPGLSPPVIYITDRSNAILLWWFLLFYVLMFKSFCAVCTLCVFHILVKFG